VIRLQRTNEVGIIKEELEVCGRVNWEDACPLTLFNTDLDLAL